MTTTPVRQPNASRGADSPAAPAVVDPYRRSAINGNRAAHGVNAGITVRFRDALARQPGMTVAQLAKHLGVGHETVRSCIRNLLDVTGGIVATGPRWERRYWLYRDAPRNDPQPNARIAGPITIGRGARWFLGAR